MCVSPVVHLSTWVFADDDHRHNIFNNNKNERIKKNDDISLHAFLVAAVAVCCCCSHWMCGVRQECSLINAIKQNTLSITKCSFRRIACDGYGTGNGPIRAAPSFPTRSHSFRSAKGILNHWSTTFTPAHNITLQKKYLNNLKFTTWTKYTQRHIRKATNRDIN